MFSKDICNFCHRKTSYVPLKLKDGDYMQVHFCRECKAEFTFWLESTSQFGTINLYVELNDTHYRYTKHTTSGDSLLYHVVEVGVPGVKSNVLKLLKRFENGPSLNPENVREKIQTMLVFL